MNSSSPWTGARARVPVLAAVALASAMALASNASGQCSNDCGTGLVDESEPCISDGGTDTTNSGCDAPTPLFTDIFCGDVVCGLGSTYDEGTARDRDWYRISQADLQTCSGGTGVVTVTASVTAEFDHSVRIMALGDPVCVDDFSLAVTTAAGAPDNCNATPTLVSAAVAAADHPQGIAIIVYPNNVSTVAICDANDGYILEVTVVGEDAACDGTARHGCGTPNPGVPGCNDPACCILVCELNPSCCIGGVQGWQPSCANRAREFCELSCVNDCGTAVVSEGEACLLDSGIDLTNGGCNLATPLFTNLFCEDTACGVASTYDGGTSRDLDWYRISQLELEIGSGGTGVVTLTAEVFAEFDHNIWIMAVGDPVCDNPVTLVFETASGVPTLCNAVATSASATILTADHPNGVAVVVGPKNFTTDAVCADNDAYTLEVFCDGLDADCDGTAPHDCLQINPEVPGCDDPDCCVLVCAVNPTCCTDLPGQGWQQNCANLAAQFCQLGPRACDTVSPVNCQLPDLAGSGGFGDSLFIGVPSDEQSAVVAADNFRAEQSGDITEVCWWGYYDDGASDCFATADDAFTITYYNNAENGLPETPPLGSFDVNATADWEGFTHEFSNPSYAVNLYRFSASHPPVGVVENQCYWIEIRKKNLLDPCVWFWETANHGLDPDFDYSLAGGYPGTYDMTDGVDIELGWCVNIVVGAVSSCAPPPPDEDCVPPGTFVLTQNNFPDTIDPLDGSINCRVPGASGYTLANWYARSYDLSDPDYGVAGVDVEVTCVRFASQANDGFAYPVTINVYEDTDGGSPVNPSSDLSLLGSTLVWVPVGARGFLEARFDTPVSVDANSTLVVELEAPDRDPAGLPPGVADGGAFWPGTNPSATTNSFIRAPECDTDDYIPISSLCPDCALSQLLQTVHVTTMGPPCPCDCEATPDGTVDAGDFLALLAQWGGPGPCDCEDPPDGSVDAGDFLALLAGWGGCPQ